MLRAQKKTGRVRGGDPAEARLDGESGGTQERARGGSVGTETWQARSPPLKVRGKDPWGEEDQARSPETGPERLWHPQEQACTGRAAGLF